MEKAILSQRHSEAALLQWKGGIYVLNIIYKEHVPHSAWLVAHWI
jgi:hypothetical protein